MTEALSWILSGWGTGLCEKLRALACLLTHRLLFTAKSASKIEFMQASVAAIEGLLIRAGWQRDSSFNTGNGKLRGLEAQSE